MHVIRKAGIYSSIKSDHQSIMAQYSLVNDLQTGDSKYATSDRQRGHL